MRGVFKIIFLLCIIPLNTAGQSQSINFKNYSVRDGLSHTKVNSICQDKHGLMWFGTEAGLNKFDGLVFHKYYSTYDSPSGLSGSNIEIIFNDGHGNLMIGTDQGLDVYNYENDSFEKFWFLSNDTLKHTQKRITSLALDLDGSLWVGTVEGLILFESIDFSESITDDPDSHDFRYTYTGRIEGLTDEFINCISRDNQGNMWIGTILGLNVYTRHNRKIMHFHHEPDDPMSLSHDYINEIFQSSDNSIWISTQRGGLNRLFQDSLGNYKFRHYLHNPDNEFSISNNTVRDIIELEKGYLWIATFNGLNIMDIHSERFIQHYPDPDNPNSLSFKSITSIYKDQHGAVWLGTYYGGIDYYDPRLNYFASYRNNKYDLESVSFNVISSMIEDENGLIWVGTEGGGLNWFQKSEEKFARVKSIYVDEIDFSEMIISALLFDRDGEIWIATHRHGLHIINQKNKSHRELILPEQRPFISDRINVTYALYQDNLDRIWIGTHGKGIFVYDKSINHFKFYLHDEANETSISSDIINAFLEDSSGNIWIATNDGLNIFYPSPGGFQRISVQNSDSLEHHVIVNCLFQDSKARIWAGTFGEGLFLLDKEKMKLVLFMDSELAEAKVIYGIEEDYNGSLWITSNQGIYQYSPSGITRNFDIHDGILSNQFSRNSILRCSDGDILFGGVNGLNSLDPEAVGMNELIPEIYISNLFINNRVVKPHEKSSPLPGHVNETSEIKLNHKQNDFGFEFVALSYIQPEKNRYRFMLDGFDNDWIEMGSENRRINYSNLKPGDYTFKVHASNNDGVWTPKPRTIAIHLKPAPWRTWWAMSLYIIIFFSLTILFLNLFSRKRKIQHELEIERFEKNKISEINQMKLQFFTNISHEIRTPLTMIISPLEKILKENRDTSLQKQLMYIQRSVQKLFDLINQLLDFRKVESNKLELHAEYFDLNEILEQIAEHFEEFCQNEGIRFIPDLDHLPVLAFLDRQKFEKIIWNLMSNAVKFTNPGGSIWFKCRVFNDIILLDVKDNGIGMPRNIQQKIFEQFYQAEVEGTEIKGTGIGLFLANKYVELHGGKIFVESEPRKGSLFRVELPVSVSRDIQYPDTKPVTVYDEKKSRDEQVAKPLQRSLDASDAKLPLLLVVEDEQDIREYLTEMFSEDFRVISASDGMAGYKLARQKLPNFIISDFKMPEMDGIEFCDKIKSNLKTSHIPFILLSAYNAIENKISGLEKGADDYIDKPFQVDILKLKVKNILKARQDVIYKYKRQFLLDPEEISQSPVDRSFLARAQEVVMKHYESPDFNPEMICRELNISRTTLHVKLKALINQSASEFIKTVRVRAAIKLLKENKYRISEIAYATGFNSPHYFTYSFKQVTGLTPSEFQEKGEKQQSAGNKLYLDSEHNLHFPEQ